MFTGAVEPRREQLWLPAAFILIIFYQERLHPTIVFLGPSTDLFS